MADGRINAAGKQNDKTIMLININNFSKFSLYEPGGGAFVLHFCSSIPVNLPFFLKKMLIPGCWPVRWELLQLT